MLPPGSGRMEKRRQIQIVRANYILASLLCASRLCAVVMLITNESIRHAVEWNDCRCHLGSAISQHGDRASSRCLPACLSLRHLLSIAVQGRIVRRTCSATDFCAGRRISSAADFHEFSWRIFVAGGGFRGGC